jgi:hypothetical protein
MVSNGSMDYSTDALNSGGDFLPFHLLSQDYEVVSEMLREVPVIAGV